MRHFDHTVNITWVMQHLNVAIKYIDQSGKGLEATGGSEYMQPKIPAKDIFPSYGADELANWGVEI
jgi:tryptophan 2,3-dioxygenase